jgi:hypothetical protein
MKKKVLLIIVLSIICVTVFYLNTSYGKGFSIIIKNNTNLQINNLVIEFPGGTKAISLKEKSKIKTNVIPKDFGEAEILLRYEENKINQREIIFGYIEPGYAGSAIIEINSIMDNGQLEIKVDSKLDTY